MSDLLKERPTADDALRALHSSDKQNASRYINQSQQEIKRLRAAVEAGLPYLVLLGGEDDRIDHELESRLEPYVNQVRDQMQAAIK